MKRNSGLADSPFFSPINPIAAAPADESPNPIQPTEANSLVTHSISKNESIVVKQPDDHPIFARKPEIGQAILPESPKSGKMANAVQMALKSKAAKKESFRFP